MATREDLDFTYTLTDRIVRLSLGQLADFSGAKYDGDFTHTLEQAQRRKYEYVDEQIGIGEGRRVLDLGCGWGPLLDFVRARGGTGVGVTLSSAHVAACRRQDLDVHLYDARLVTRESFGSFDAVTMLGAFEHICSPEDFLARRQEEIYSGHFERLAGLLPDKGRFYMQTMVFGRNAPPAQENLDALRALPERDSDAWYLALMGHQFPGSWLPLGQEQIVRCAQPHFQLLSSSNGRLDYLADDRRVEPAHRHTQLPKDAAQASARAALALQRRLPPGVRLRRERQQSLLRARAARPFPACIPEGVTVCGCGRTALSALRRHA